MTVYADFGNSCSEGDNVGGDNSAFGIMIDFGRISVCSFLFIFFFYSQKTLSISRSAPRPSLTQPSAPRRQQSTTNDGPVSM